MRLLPLLSSVMLLAVHTESVIGACLNWTSSSLPTARFLPQGLSVGDGLSLETGNITAFTLSTTTPFVTLDYGRERSGYPFFSVTDVDQSAQIEVKYSEWFVGLDHPWADGPYTFATGLSNSFRVETFNVTSAGQFASSLIQGGQRWQSMRLISGGNITFDLVGLEATVDTTEVENMPGQFDCDDEQLVAIWSLGAVAASSACVENGTQGAVWEVDSVKGAFIKSMRPTQSIAGALFVNYTLSFDTMIDRAGVWWALAFPMGTGDGLHLQLVSELPEATTFVNTNTTQTPANSILLSYGYDFVNQTTLDSYYLDTFAVPFPVLEQTWYRVTTALGPDGQLSVAINGQEVVNISITDYYTPAAVAFSGSFGFGAWQDQAAYVRNVTVTDTSNGSTIYANTMTSTDILSEYGTRTNPESVCLDGAKRDRLVWLGDFYHTAGIIGVSTSRYDLAQGTLRFLLASQLPDGEMNITPAMGYDPAINTPYAPAGFFPLSDYQLLGTGALYRYIRQTNDLDFLRETWSGWQLQVDWIISQIDSTDGLMHVLVAFLGPGAAGSAMSCLAVQALRELSELADAIGDSATQARCVAAADAMAQSINSELWNEDLGIYSASTDDETNYSVAGSAFCITSGVASLNQTSRVVSALQELVLWPGYKDSSADDSTDTSIYISPNTNGFLLDALFKSQEWATGYALIQSLWGAMISNPESNTGASWEYVDQNGDPGLGLFTSLAHPWGGAATYVLTEWAAGVQPAPGVHGFGYANWVVTPDAGLAMGLKRASATVQTPSGALSVQWEVVSGTLHVLIDAPPATNGTFKLNNETMSLCGEIKYDLTRQV